MDKFEGPVLRQPFVLRACNRGKDPHEGAVSTIQPDRIGNEKNLGPIFAGRDPAMRLIPIEHEIPVISVSNNIAVNRYRCAVWPDNRNAIRLDRRPAGPREAVLWRMDGVAGALRREERDV